MSYRINNYLKKRKDQNGEERDGLGSLLDAGSSSNN